MIGHSIETVTLNRVYTRDDGVSFRLRNPKSAEIECLFGNMKEVGVFNWLRLSITILECRRAKGERWSPLYGYGTFVRPFLEDRLRHFVSGAQLP